MYPKIPLQTVVNHIGGPDCCEISPVRQDLGTCGKRLGNEILREPLSNASVWQSNRTLPMFPMTISLLVSGQNPKEWPTQDLKSMPPKD